MVKAISVKKRWEIVFLATHRLGPKLPIRRISREVKCSRQTVQHWVKVFKETGDVEEKPLSGRKKKTTAKQDSEIIKLALSNRASSSQQLSTELKAMGVDLSAATVRRRLKASGIYSCTPQSKPLLLKRHRKKSLEWAKENESRDWNKVLFSEEITFKLFTKPRAIWRRRKEKIYFRSVKHPGKIHAWGCIAANGFGKLILFKKNLTSALLIKIYQKGLRSSANNLFEGD